MAKKWRTVRARHDSVVHYAPVVPAEPWMVDRVTLCWPRGYRKAWFEDYGGTVTCVRCRMLIIGKGGGERD